MTDMQRDLRMIAILAAGAPGDALLRRSRLRRRPIEDWERWAPSPQYRQALVPSRAFDLTGTWLHGGGAEQPLPVLSAAGLQAHARGADALRRRARSRRPRARSTTTTSAHCWPAGLPIIMTRVWPIAMIQMPTAIYMISGFMNSIRIIYPDGRAAHRSRHRDSQLQRRIHRPLGRRHAGGGYHQLRATIITGSTAAFRPATSCTSIERMKSDRQRRNAADRIHDDRSQELGRRVEVDQALAARGRYRYHRGIVPARSQRAHAQHQSGAYRPLKESQGDTMKALLAAAHFTDWPGAGKLGLCAPFDERVQSRENDHASRAPSSNSSGPIRIPGSKWRSPTVKAAWTFGTWR